MSATIERPAAPAAAASAAPAAVAAPAAARPNRIPLIVLSVLALIAVGFGVSRWRWGLTHVSTDNAQVEGHIIPTLARVSGFVAEVTARENEQVEAGAMLVRLGDYRQAVKAYRGVLREQPDLQSALEGLSLAAELAGDEELTALAQRRLRSVVAVA